MLTQNELKILFDRLGTPESGRRLVLEARQNAPVRQVRFNGSNVRHRYPSAKMGRVIETESRSAEFRANIQYEFDAKVLEYYPQPCQLDLWIHKEDPAKRTRIQHTPDFILIQSDELCLVEWKTEKKLVKLALQDPERYVPEGPGWRSPMLEDYLREFGIRYQLRSDREHNSTFVENLQFLAQYYDESWPAVESTALLAIKSQFQQRAVVYLGELIDRAQQSKSGELITCESNLAERFTPDDLYKAIAEKEVWFDIENDDLSDTNRALIYRDQAAMVLYQIIDETSSDASVEPLAVSIEDGASVDFDGKNYTIGLVGKEKVMLEGEYGPKQITIDLLKRFHLEGALTIHAKPKRGMDLATRMAAWSPKALEEAVRRFKILEQAKQDPKSVSPSRRTLQRWKKEAREAGESLVDQKMALVSKYGNCGWGTERIPKELISIIDSITKKYYNTPDNISKSAAYNFLVAECEIKNIKPCTYKTFISKMRRSSSDRERLGKKAAYQLKPITSYIDREDRIHGSRPWQYVHIDHTQLEIFCIDANSKRCLGKPWISAAIDAESRAILGFVLSFEKPSYRSCQMLLRDMVRRSNRLPETIVLDNGKEFHSQSFTRFAGLYGITLAYRPAGEARFGCLIERFFGTLHTELIRNLKGNTQLLKNPRAMSKSVQPEGRAAWTLYGLHHVIENFNENIYGKTPHPAHRNEDYQTPVEHLSNRMFETGERHHCMVRYDSQLLIESCPEPRDKPTRTIDAQRGIRFHNFLYQSKALHSPKLAGKEVQVRVDPWDCRYIYALIDDHWERCVSIAAMKFRKFTELERRYANDRARRSIKKSGRKYSPDAFAEWMDIHDPANFDPVLAEQQAALLAVYKDLNMTDVQCLSHDSEDESVDSKIEANQHAEPKKSTASTVKTAKPEKAHINNNSNSSKEAFVGYDLL